MSSIYSNNFPILISEYEKNVNVTNYQDLRR